jgi:hypothetical protein
MKEITLKIPNKKLSFFLELVRQLNIEITEEVDLAGEVDETEIPEKHKEMVRQRIETANPKEMVPWSEARDQFKFKGKS